MGQVLAARDLTLDREVAIKVLLPGRSSADAARRFVTESKVTARLPHPNIPPVHALGALPDGLPYLAMKLVQGKTLAELLKARGSPAEGLPRFVQVFEQVCQAVGFAHAQGVIHRDLKPANVMVGSFGEVQVMDWGLAKDLTGGGHPPPGGSGEAPEDSSSGSESHAPGRPCETVARPPLGAEPPPTHTVYGAVMGSPPYMPPEQACGRHDRLGPPADVFALGGILCDILTGSPPYVGDTALALLAKAGASDLADAFARLDGCGADPELAALAKRCLAPDPADRPRDGRAVADAVAAYRAGVEGRLWAAERDRAAAAARTAEQRKRRRVQLALATAVGLIAAGGGAVAWWADKQAGERRAEALCHQIDEERREQVERERLARNGQAVELLLGQCEDGLRAGDAARVAIPLEQAERRAAEGGAEACHPRLARCRSDLDMLRDLDRLEGRRWGAVGAAPGGKEAEAEWGGVFRRFGISQGGTSRSEAVRRVTESHIRERLLTVLDWGLVYSASPALAAVLGEADPDPFRDEVRGAVRAKDWARVRALGGRSAAREQPAHFAVVLASVPGLAAEDRERVLQAALRRRPGHFQVLMALGDLHRQLTGHSGEAVGWYHAALATRPASVAAWNALAAALGNKGDADAAVAAIRESIRLDPGYAAAYFHLGQVLQAKGDVGGAVAAYREGVRLDPAFGPGPLLLGAALQAKGDVDGAVAAFREAARLDPKSAPSFTALGTALHAKGDLTGAAAAYRQAIRLDPNSAVAHNQSGYALLAGREYDGALAAIREAVRLAPDAAEYRDSLGDVLDAMGRADEAIAAYREALRLDPRHAAARANLDRVLRVKAEREGRIAPPPRAVNR